MLKDEEKALSQTLQREDVWRHLWGNCGDATRTSGVFEVESSARLHDVLSGLPLFPYMQVELRPLGRHASSMREGRSRLATIEGGSA